MELERGRGAQVWVQHGIIEHSHIVPVKGTATEHLYFDFDLATSGGHAECWVCGTGVLLCDCHFFTSRF